MDRLEKFHVHGPAWFFLYLHGLTFLVPAWSTSSLGISMVGRLLERAWSSAWIPVLHWLFNGMLWCCIGCGVYVAALVLHGKGAAGCSIGFRKLVLAWVAVIGFSGSTSDWLVMLNFTTLVFLSSVWLLLALGLFILCSFLWEHVPILVSGYWLPPSLYIYFVFCYFCGFVPLISIYFLHLIKKEIRSCLLGSATTILTRSS